MRGMKIGTNGELPGPASDLDDAADAEEAHDATGEPDLSGVVVRRATVADAEALVRLRALMLEAMGTRVGGQDAPWRARARTWFAERLAATDEFAAFVVDDPELGVVSNAVGTCDRHAPGPNNLSGLHGHVSNVCTDPRRLRRGYARACLEAVLDWFAEETQARVINLNATPDGADLYTDLGFAAPRHPALQVRLDGTIAPVPVAPPLP
ncbi:Ribosomal protein S18 acetylase RimI [Actinacidiphila alni]|uniref:Ribosomal protein S18 acetylase RimI n=2 Tax=Actinacidiphila alni TaxID=380248 RepID=A0A1I2IVP2_9ACTN|nr:Ribosomal protein S18 acetylase RimI [Actinacidiphila alni]